MKYDYCEFYVGNGRAMAFWHVYALGFNLLGLNNSVEGGNVSYFLRKGDIKLIITSSVSPVYSLVNSFTHLHGDSIKRIAIRVEDVKQVYNKSVGSGAIPILPPYKVTDVDGFIEKAHLKLFDDNEIVLINYDHYSGKCLPGFVELEQPPSRGDESVLQSVDHIAFALRENETRIWETYLNNIFESKTVQELKRGAIGTGRSGLLMKVLQSEDRSVKNVLVEPDNDTLRSQIQIFLDNHYSSGIQHIAFSTSDIFKSIEQLSANGIQFTKYPKSYYVKLRDKYPELDVDKFEKYGVLCDVEDESLLLQTFTQPIGDRPTLFYELVQRVNEYKGFGIGNIRTLFEAVEETFQNLKIDENVNQ